MEGSLVTLNPVDIGLLLPGAVAVCLLAVSALVSGAETSFFSLTPHDIRDIKAHPEKSSNDAILRLLGDVDQLLATILVVNNLVNICIVILAARIINLLFTFGSAGMRFLFESSSPLSCCCFSARSSPRYSPRAAPCGSPVR